MAKLLLLLALSIPLASITLTESAAQMVMDRPLPSDGKRGVTGAPQVFPIVEISGRLFKMAPGGVIFDQNNRSLVHGSLPQQADVYFTQDPTGLVMRVYVLTPIEQERFNRAGR